MSGCGGRLGMATSRVEELYLEIVRLDSSKNLQNFGPLSVRLLIGDTSQVELEFRVRGMGLDLGNEYSCLCASLTLSLLFRD